MQKRIHASSTLPCALIVKGKTFLVLVLVLSLSACANSARISTSMKAHPDIVWGKREIRSVAILPPDAELERHSLFGSKRDSEKENAIQKRLAELAPKLVEEHGYLVNSSLTL